MMPLGLCVEASWLWQESNACVAKDLPRSATGARSFANFVTSPKCPESSPVEGVDEPVNFRELLMQLQKDTSKVLGIARS